MSKQRIISAACVAVIVFAIIGPGSGSVSADESVPPSTTTTLVEQFDEESGLMYSRIDETTIEVSLPD